MKAEVKELLTAQPPEIKISHNNEELLFLANTFGKNSFNVEYDVFEQINNYWAGLTIVEQDYIFNLYKEILLIFQNHYSRVALTNALTEPVTRLIKCHDFDRMYQWILFKSDIMIPECFDKEYVDSIDKQGSREQTYIRSDYTKLVTLALILRTMVPIWGEFIRRTKDELGNDFKEYYAFQLLNKCSLLEGEAFYKLRIFIESNLKTDTVNSNRIFSGISTEDFPNWLLSIISVRKLCVGNIRGTNAKTHLVSFVFQFISQKTRGGDIPVENIIKNKVHESNSQNELADKLSVLERYKLKQNLSGGEIVELEHSIKDLRHIAFRLSANMTDGLFDSCLKSSRILLEQKILIPQMNMLRWVMKPVISPRGVLYLGKEKIVELIGVTQAVLWARGHKYLSLLVCSYPILISAEVFITTTDSRAKLSKELIAELDLLYPYSKIIPGKKNNNKPINLAINTIDTTISNLNRINWNTSADDEFILEVFGNVNSKRIPLAYDTKAQLAKLILELGKRSWT